MLGEIITLSGDKLTYDCEKDRWDSVPVTLRVSSEPFGEGGMRLAYRAREVLPDGFEFDVVVKRFRSDLEDEGYTSDDLFQEAVTQMVAENYAQDFNKACAARGLRHTIAFLPASVVKVKGVPDEETEVLSLEPYLEGEYVKHNDNQGHNETEDEVVAAFCYFTYISSGKLSVVCDIQGVGTFYTDPQIHTFDGEGFGAGNLGPEGIDRFLRNHRHNLVCEQLGLPSPDEGLSDEELARKMQAAEEREAREEAGLPTSTWTRERYDGGVDELARMFARQ